MLNDIGLSVWKSKYAKDGKETYEQGCKRVADYLEVPQVEQLMLEQKFIPGGRVLYGAGNEKAFLTNCALFSAEDDTSGWAKLLHDATLSLMYGLGLGISYDKVREYGAPIKGKGGFASGPISLMAMVNEVARHIIQGGSRRSACYSSLYWKHPDVQRFIGIKNWDSVETYAKSISTDYPATLDLTNISVRLDKKFIEEYHKGNDTAVAVWSTLTQNMFSMSEPGIQFDNDWQILRNA